MCAEIVLQSPLDMHIHFREGAMLDLVAPLSADTFAGGVIMPNLVPPVADAERLAWYTAQVQRAVGDRVFDPYMTLFFRSYSEAELAALKDQIIGIKLYPAGATTNSEGGVESVADAEATLAIMQEMGIPLLVHGENPDAFVLDREGVFLPTYEELAQKFPRLKIVMEHITTAEAVALLDRYENLHATVTLQHLIITLDDVAGGLLNPHLFCKPIAKRPEDRDALLQAAERLADALEVVEELRAQPKQRRVVQPHPLRLGTQVGDAKAERRARPGAGRGRRRHHGAGRGRRRRTHRSRSNPSAWRARRPGHPSAELLHGQLEI